MAFWNRSKELAKEINEMKGMLKAYSNMHQSQSIPVQSVPIESQSNFNQNQEKQNDSWDLTDPDNFSKAINNANSNKELDWIDQKRKMQLKVKNSERMKAWKRKHPGSPERLEEDEDTIENGIPDEWFSTAIDAWNSAPKALKNPINNWMKENLHFEIDDILGDQQNFNRVLGAIRNQKSIAPKEEK
ncbi:MAG: hypothetical protein M1459_01050, partial [Patescibacteria group bacterium]|nr:hypothetical protein [Patescibacteria group bacterium]